MPAQTKNDDLTRLLRQGDPLAAEPELAESERRQMRRTILSQVPERRLGSWRQLSPALSVAVLLAIALAIAWFPDVARSPVDAPRPHGPATPSATKQPSSPAMQQAGDSLESRKIQFETPGGTLVVWVLNPNFPS